MKPTAAPAFDLGEYLPYLVNRVGVRIATAFARELAPHGLSLPMWRMLAVLAQAGASRQIDLAGLTSIDPSTLSRLVKTVQGLGLVSRMRSAASQREVTIALTPRGRAVVKALIPSALDYEARAIRGLDARELALVKGLLRRVYDNMDATG
ncbi:MAG: MarR family transcriptional regulator [Pseudomonadota bacterium]